MSKSQEAIQWQNDVWQRAGRELMPSDPALQAEMDQARAAQWAAWESTLLGPVYAFCSARWSGGPEAHSRYAPYAVLFLQWETRYPDEWHHAAIGGWGTKKEVLRRFIAAGPTPDTQADLLELLTAAIYREHRCEDSRYAALARQLDGPSLRCCLASAQQDHDGLVRLRAGYMQWVVDNATAPVTAASWRRWLAGNSVASRSR
ncbi:hypothetical protein SAMN05444365_11623 [Micromonospora pattaloongensis]|uniref:Uncharacterized protein n=2 Tax=Micromonospora pattaloongensis TaxID=405436 RepID=A0A1H3T1B1_9ACTN|nr:hypothetical protein SAMN05444365_11623 [Micromonospora pattaloongensis]